MNVKDQADTLRRLMGSRKAAPEAPVISVFLAPEVRKARLFSPRELALYARARGAGFRVRDESDPLAASPGNARVIRRLAAVSGDEVDVLACYQRLKSLLPDLGADRSVKKMDVLVCVAVDGPDRESQGRRIFTQLFEACRRFLDVDLAYVGTVARGEKIRDCLAIEKYLIHCSSGSREGSKDAGCVIGR
ncbi:MAG: hypothetical protein JST04_02110 [Bdellovibrionales bacterium]|nr:hypothetical protein [Bdellovibrionales bacterium]